MNSRNGLGTVRKFGNKAVKPLKTLGKHPRDRQNHLNLNKAQIDKQRTGVSHHLVKGSGSRTGSDEKGVLLKSFKSKLRSC